MKTKFKISVFEQEIKKSIQNNNMTIVATSTGSGKTMAVPYWAHEVTGLKVHCLVPRVVMARQAMKGAQSLVWPKPTKVGLMTGRGDVRGEDCVYTTEGSFIMRKTIEKLPKGSVILMDEVHEQGAITEATLYIAKQWMDAGFKIVLLSATMDCERYAKFFDGYTVGIIDYQDSERPFKLDFQIVSDPMSAIANAAKNGGRCLVGLEGKGEMSAFANNLKRLLGNQDIPVFQVHGELENEDMDAAIDHKGPAVYIATNVMQSGVTIPNLTHGYFNGVGKRIETVNGSGKLVKYELSQSENIQWFGRIGRNCDGIIYRTQQQENRFKQLPFMPTPEIQLIPLLDIILQFADYGIDIETAKLLNMPNEANIKAAINSLKTLGYMGADKKISPLGRSYLRIGKGVRGNIMLHWGKLAGIENTMRKIQMIDYIGHPFRNTNGQLFKSHLEEFGYSEYMLYIAVIEQIMAEYGPNVSQTDFPLFKEAMEKHEVFRRNLVKLMKAFADIDENYQDESFANAKVKMVLYLANRDRIVRNGKTDNGQWVGRSFKAKAVPNEIVFGEIMTVGTSTFIESPTYISNEEETAFKAVLGVE